MLSDRCALKLHVAVAEVGTHQAEVSGSTPDITNENQVAIPQSLQEHLSMLCYPGIECGQRFFQEGQVLQSGLVRRFDRQLPGLLVERRRNRQNDLLFFEELFWIARNI